MSNNQIITISLAYSVDARTFNREEIVHPIEFDKIIELINNDIINAKFSDEGADNDQFVKDRYHNAITVLGTRGSGKTSFLLSVLKHYSNHENVEVLKIVDPTLIEEKGHIFLNVLSIINDRVEENLKKVGYKDLITGESDRKIWDRYLEELAGGLPSIDGIGTGLDQTNWQDPEYIMQRGIRLVTASRHLENNFDKLVRFALKILKKEAFILAFDDIDIDFKKGWPVLETIRKYFVSPKLITLLSGDMRLYSLSVRKRQWQNFGEELISNPNEMVDGSSTYLKELVRETESQYLQKVMKPERRIHLTTLRDKTSQSVKIKVNIESLQQGSVEIAEYYKIIFNRIGIHNNYQIEIYQSFLLNSPLRLQLRFLSIFLQSSDLTAGLSLLDPFVSDLYEQRVDLSQISSSSQFVNIGILNFLMSKHLLSENYQLQPLTDNAGLNGTMTAFTLLFAIQSEKNAASVFDYLVRVGYIRNILSSIGYDEVLQNPGLNQHMPTIEGLCRHSGILQDKVLKDSIGMVTAYVNAFLETGKNTEKSWGGMITLPGRAKRGKRNSRTNRDRIDAVAAGTSGLKSSLIYFPLSISQSAVSQNETLTYSFHVLIAVIAELIRKSSSGDTYKGMLELAQLRSYPMPDFKQKSNISTGTDFDDDTDDEEFVPNDDLEIFENKLTEWAETYPAVPIPPHILGKVSTRTFFAFTEIHRKQQRRKLGEIMHAMCVTFLNAVFIEDAKEHVQRPVINLNNPVYSDRLFIQNLNNRTRASDGSLKLSRWLVSCPLFMAYLNPRSEELMAALGSFTHNDRYSSAVRNVSVFEDLQKVRVKQKLSMPRDLHTVIASFGRLGIEWEDVVESNEDEMELNGYLSEYNASNQPILTMDRLKRMIDYAITEDDD